MFEENQKTNDAWIDTVISTLDRHDDKIKDHDQKIEVVQKRLDDAPDPASDIKSLKSDVGGLLRSSQNQKLTDEKLEQLKPLLGQAILALRQPVTNTVEHHHHIHKIIWIALSLFLLVCVTAMGWLESNANLRDFVANDLKYRRLKLTADSASLVYLFRIDSVYAAEPDGFRENVIEEERMKAERLELLDKTQELEHKINSLSKKPGSLKGK
jgi:hypothetical protein